MQQTKTWAQMSKELEAKLNKAQGSFQKPWREGTLTVKLAGNVFNVMVEDEDFNKKNLARITANNNGVESVWYNNSVQYNTQSVIKQVIEEVF